MISLMISYKLVNGDFFLSSSDLLSYIPQYSEVQPLFWLSRQETRLLNLQEKMMRKTKDPYPALPLYKQKFAGYGEIQSSLTVHPKKNWKSGSKTEK